MTTIDNLMKLMTTAEQIEWYSNQAMIRHFDNRLKNISYTQNIIDSLNSQRDYFIKRQEAHVQAMTEQYGAK